MTETKVEGLTGMVKDVLGNESGKLSKDITEDIVKLQVGDSRTVQAYGLAAWP